MYSQALFSPAPPPGLRSSFRPSEARRRPRTTAPIKMVRQ